jgi:branched-chain amino acid aminotransferase
MRKVWHNGQIIDEKDAKVSIYDSAMMFGDTCFEMMRTFNKNTFRLQEHLDRLEMSCKILEIDYPDKKDFLFTQHEDLLKWHIENFPEVEEWRSLVNITRGILPLYQNMLNEYGFPNITIAIFPLSEILKGKYHLYEKGIHAIVPSQRAIPHHLLDARLKTRSRQHYQMANLEVARQDKEAWPLLLDEHGFVAESTGSNFFIVKDGIIYTPHGLNCLKGISRNFIFDLCNVYCENISLFDVYNADEAFFTCTPYSIVPCTNINWKPIGDGQVGEVTKQITQAWIGEVECDFVDQIRRWY